MDDIDKKFKTLQQHPFEQLWERILAHGYLIFDMDTGEINPGISPFLTGTGWTLEEFDEECNRRGRVKTLRKNIGNNSSTPN